MCRKSQACPSPSPELPLWAPGEWGGGCGGLAAAETSQRSSSPLIPWLPSMFVFCGQKSSRSLCALTQAHSSKRGTGHAATHVEICVHTRPDPGQPAKANPQAPSSGTDV